MGPSKKTSKPSETLESHSQASTQKRDNIKWDLRTDEALSHRLSEKYKDWEYGNKVGFCRDWAKQMGFGHLDPKGARTKTHIHSMLQKFAAAKDLEKQSGGGTILVKRKIKGKWTEEEVDILDQQSEICPTFKILDVVFGQKHANCKKGAVGINEDGLVETQPEIEMSLMQDLVTQEAHKGEFEWSLSRSPTQETETLEDSSTYVKDIPREPQERNTRTNTTKVTTAMDTEMLPSASKSDTSNTVNIRSSSSSDYSTRLKKRSNRRDEIVTPITQTTRKRFLSTDDMDSDYSLEKSSEPKRKRVRKSIVAAKSDPLQGFLGFLGNDQKNQRDRIKLAQTRYEAQLAENSKEAIELRKRERDKTIALEERKLKNAELMTRIEQIKLARELNMAVEELFPDYDGPTIPPIRRSRSPTVLPMQNPTIPPIIRRSRLYGVKHHCVKG